MRGSDLVKRQQWMMRLERFNNSEQTVAEFCRREGVSVPSFYQWRRKLAAAEQNSNSTRVGTHKSSPFKQLHLTTANASPAASIRLPDGIVIELASDWAAIEKVVEILLDRQASGRTA